MNRKLTLIIILTSTVSLLTACIGLAIYDMMSVRASMAKNLAILTDLVGSSNSARLVFDRPDEVEEALGV
ncbi:MAG: hypothetical protein N2C14_08230, partial [Planctomycetales bacterium]